MSSTSTKIRLFRMVHFQNIPYILTHGILVGANDPNYISIGDSRLINQRKKFLIDNKQHDKLGGYIPFYFSGHTPMLLNIKTGHRGITKREQSEIVFIVCEVNNIVNNCAKWLFTDGHAKDALSNFYEDLKDLDKLDWDLIKSQYWKNTREDNDRMRRKQAEFLVYNKVSLNCIRGLIVKSEERKLEIEKIIQNLGLSLIVHIDKTNKYFYP